MKYKIGDKVKIKSIEWYNQNKDQYGLVACGYHVFTEDMSKFCGQTMIVCNRTNLGVMTMGGSANYWTDEMIEGLADEMIEGLADAPQKMVSLEKVEEWLYKNFYESYNLNNCGEYELDKPYIASLFDTINEMFEDFRKIMEK